MLTCTWRSHVAATAALSMKDCSVRGHKKRLCLEICMREAATLKQQDMLPRLRYHVPLVADPDDKQSEYV